MSTLDLVSWVALGRRTAARAARSAARPPLPVDTAGHWFMMQVGMIVGYATAWPANRRLIHKGWKEEMG